MIYNAPINEIIYSFKTCINNPKINGIFVKNNLNINDIEDMIYEFNRFIQNKWVPSNKIADTIGVKLVDKKIIVPDIFYEAYQEYLDAGWNTLEIPTEYDGQNFPLTVNCVFEEILSSANLALSLLIMLNNKAIKTINTYATQEIKDKFIPNLCNGKYAATMQLTEANAGSDLSQIKTTAIQEKNQEYFLLSGEKTFITWGDHSLTENIIHLVLAKTDQKNSLSLFLVPKFLENNEKNNVNVTSIEHKMGLSGSPTCTVNFNNAKSYLLGNKGLGLKYMFTMMNFARLAVGIEAHAVANVAYQNALQYAYERKQGKDLINKDNESTAIINHPDVKRMILIQKSTLKAQRCIYVYTTSCYDIAKEYDDKLYEQLFYFLIPIVKTFNSENGNELTNLALQIYGGYGYIEEMGMSQYVRDNRIASIYEGTNAIQSLDFLFRKTIKNEGKIALYIIEQGENITNNLAKINNNLANKLNDYLAILKKSLQYILNNAKNKKEIATGSMSYIMLFATALGGVLLSNEYIQLDQNIKEHNDNSPNLDFYHEQIDTIKIYFDYIMPKIFTYYNQLISGTNILNFDNNYLAQK